MTSLLDPRVAPAAEPVELYHRGWEHELAFAEPKAHLAERRVETRARTPVGVSRDVWGLLPGHRVVRSVMAEAGGARLRPRRPRLCPRVVKGGRDKFPSQKPHHKEVRAGPFRDRVVIP